MSTRRDALKLGLAVGGSALAAPESGLGQLCLDDGISPSTVPPSPPTRPFIAPLFIPPIAQPVPEDTLTPRPNPGRHQRYGEFHPRKFYVQREQQFLWLYHPDLPPTPTWGWDGVSPGATFHAYYGEPIFVRRYNDLPEVNGSASAWLRRRFTCTIPTLRRKATAIPATGKTRANSGTITTRTTKPAAMSVSE